MKHQYFWSVCACLKWSKGSGEIWMVCSSNLFFSALVDVVVVLYCLCYTDEHWRCVRYRIVIFLEASPVLGLFGDWKNWGDLLKWTTITLLVEPVSDDDDGVDDSETEDNKITHLDTGDKKEGVQSKRTTTVVDCWKLAKHRLKWPRWR